MQTVTRSSFTSVKTEGGLLPADLLQRIADGREVAGLRPEDYHLLPGERLNEAVNRAWNRCLGAWLSFDEQRRKLPAAETGATLTRERWLLLLFQELGYGRLQLQRGGLASDDGTAYPVSHLWEQTPIHLVTFRQGLDRRSDVATQLKRSPHSMMQELLNRARRYTWGIISNGLQLRILRDNASLRRAAYVEFDLESMMTGELYAEFSLLWLVCHQSRVERVGDAEIGRVEIGDWEIGSAEDDNVSSDDAQSPISQSPISSSWLERWSKLAAEQGARAMDALRDGVAEAIAALGGGFLAHPANHDLRDRLARGELSTQEYYKQLRRLVYRLIFLFVAEDRNLLLLPDTPPALRRRYDACYSLRRLRELAGTVRGGPHTDLYRVARLLFVQLRTGYPALGLPGLGSALFSNRATPDLDAAELANQPLLTAIRALTLTVENSVRRPVDYRNLDSEELGSIYESLLELHPAVNLAAATFTLNLGAGSERKTTGSHYTPTPLVENLLDSALEPVVAARLRQASSVTQHGSRITPAEAALLSIKVCDGAMGSGHMLIGAGRRLAKHLARIRTGDAEPAPPDLRAALRDVVRHCLYGVDVNDMAVELCKVALWMETMEPGKPLSFLDAHIQCGNSLIGVTPGLEIAEIPDDAFQPVTGDDRTTAAGLRRRNKKEREGQLALEFGAGATTGSTARHAEKRAQMVAAIEELAEDDVAAVAAKARSYAEYLQSPEYKWARWEADTWTAAFFWPIARGDAGELAAPTQNVLRAVRDNKLKQQEAVLREVRHIARQHQFFHWALQFPEVFASEAASHEPGVTSHESSVTDDASRVTRDASRLFPRAPGFDVMLMNPPWERIKLQEKEWFAARSPEIAAAPNAAARKRLIAALETGDPALWRAFQADVRAAESESHFIRNSGHYPLCGRGDVNTYAIFAELVRQVQAPAGYVGIIVPTGIATDDTTKFYFQEVMASGALASLYDFENRQAIFPGVHRSYKFCLLTLRGAAEEASEPAEFVFFALDVEALKEAERRFTLTAAEIALLNPNTRTCPIFRSRRDAELTKAIYLRSDVFRSGNTRTWNFKLGTQFHSSMDAYKFEEFSEYIASGWRIDRYGVIKNGDKKVYRLYEGKMFNLFDHRAATVVVSDSAVLRQRQSRLTSESEHKESGFLAQSFFCVRDSEFTGYPQWKWNLCFKKVTSPTNERTLISTLLPECAANDSIHLLIPEGNNTSAASCCSLLGEISSYIVDYVTRQKLGGVNLNFFIFEQLPIHQPGLFAEACNWANHMESLNDWLLPRVLELTYTAWDLQPFARDCGYDGPPFRWDEDRRFLLRCELDAAYFHLYGIARDDVDYILETFPIVKRKEIARHGEYRTRRVILEMYDEMAGAMQGGAPYATRLDPPPADRRVAHEA